MNGFQKINLLDVLKDANESFVKQSLEQFFLSAQR